MKTRLPALSALSLALVAMASLAWPHRAAGQPGVTFFNDNWPTGGNRADPTDPYRADAAPDEPPIDASLDRLPPGDQIVVQARRRLEQRASVFAKLLHQSNLEGRELSGAGSYWQQGGSEPQVYLELQIAGLEASQLQVANDRFLWIDRKLPTGRTVSRIDLRALRAEERVWKGKPLHEFGGPPAYNPTSIYFSAQQGGLPGLLAAFVDNFTFLPPQAMRLSTRPSVHGEAHEVPVFAVVGHWKRPKLAQIVPASEPAKPGSDPPPEKSPPIPGRIPQEVLLLIGQADLFPYRIEYRRLETPPLTANEAQAVPYQLSADPLVVLELLDVVFDVPIAAGQFDYAPPANINWNDQTAGLIERLRKERAAYVATETDPPATQRPTVR